MIVIDASSAYVALAFDGDARYWLQIEELHAPHVIDCELTNTLRRQEQRRLISGEIAQSLLNRWTEIEVRRYPIVGLLRFIWQLRANMTAYDAAYVALAQVLGCQLATADRRLAAAPGMQGRVITLAS